MNRHVCPYPGRYKLVKLDERVTPLYCRAHADDWQRQFPTDIRVEPRLILGPQPCAGDWPLPAETP